MRLILLVLALAVPAAAAAQPGTMPPGGGAPPPGYGYGYAAPPPPFQRHQGVFLRLQAGIGGMALRADSTFDSIRARGNGGFFTLAAGSSITRDAVLFAELSVFGMNNPRVESGGVEYETEGFDVGVFGFGGGAAYFLQPANVHFAGSLLITKMRATQSGEDWWESESGLGMSLSLGKEWWVSPEWGLGGALRVFFADLDDPDPAVEEWGIASIALLFSATYH